MVWFTDCVFAPWSTYRTWTTLHGPGQRSRWDIRWETESQSPLSYRAVDALIWSVTEGKANIINKYRHSFMSTLSESCNLLHGVVVASSGDPSLLEGLDGQECVIGPEAGDHYQGSRQPEWERSKKTCIRSQHITVINSKKKTFKKYIMRDILFKLLLPL